MQSFNEDCIILRRTDYGEADRIVTFLTKQHGQIGGMAKGVRRPKSKLAGGLELLSLSKVTFIRTKGELYTIRSARMEEHFGEIIKDYDRMLFAYAVIDTIHTMTRDVSEESSFDLLYLALKSVNDTDIELDVVKVWFYVHALKIIGQQPNLETDTDGAELEEAGEYSFDRSQAAFSPQKGGRYNSDHIKTLRLLIKSIPKVSSKVAGVDIRASEVLPDIERMFARILSLGA